MTTRSKFFQLEEAEGGYIAGCSLCYWVDSFTSKRTARAAFLVHDCQRELPPQPLYAEDEWWVSAQCAGMDTNLFYEPDTINDAIAICNVCTVQRSCLYSALVEERHSLGWGVRGGLTGEERMAMKHG